MDLLNENQYQEKETPKGKKIVLVLLILSIILVIVIIALMAYLKSIRVKPSTLFINDEAKELPNNLIIPASDGTKYIELKGLADLLGYEYDNSEYQKYDFDTSKCYIKNDKLISGFEQDSKTIFKYEEGTNLDYQYYTLTHDVIVYNSNLYLSMEDLKQAINVKCIINENNEIRLSTVEYLAGMYQEKLRETGYTVVTDQNNRKAIAYDWIIVSKNNIWSVLNPEFEEIIGGAKYSSIVFDEYNLNYIVANTNGQYGIIKNTGHVEQQLKYDELEILNYKNMLYKVKSNNKYGIIRKDGSILANIIYDDIGYPADPQNHKVLYTLIIPKSEAIPKETIVVKANGRYGLIYLENGEQFLPCDHLEKLYSVSELGEVKYMIEAEKQTMDLVEYLKRRQIVVEL